MLMALSMVLALAACSPAASTPTATPAPVPATAEPAGTALRWNTLSETNSRTIIAAPMTSVHRPGTMSSSAPAFYFGCISSITPPVAMAAYAGAAIAGCDPNKAGSDRGQ